MKPAVLSFDINKADTSLLKGIYGIGEVFSVRILKYRDLLGGYVDLDQLKEIYGLKEESAAQVKNAVFIDSLFSPRKIRLNFAEWEDLVRHPYINSELAGELVRRRSADGPYKKPEDLKKVSALNDSIFYKLIPYLEF